MNRLESAPNLPIIEEMRAKWDDAVANQRHWAIFPARSIMERISLYQLYNGVSSYAYFKALTADRPSEIFAGINGQSIGESTRPKSDSKKVIIEDPKDINDIPSWKRGSYKNWINPSPLTQP